MQRLRPKSNSVWLLTTLLCIAVLVMLLVGKSSHHNSVFATEYVKSAGDTLDVAIQLDPSVYRVVGDSAWGKDYELLMQIASRYNVPMKLHPFVPLNHAMSYLEEGKYDMLVASMPLTSQLRSRFLMTEPVYLDREVLVQRRDTAAGGMVKSQIELGGDTLWIAHDSPIKSRIENLAHEIGDTIYVQSDSRYSAEHLLILVSKGIIKRAVVNEGVAKAMRNDYPDVDTDTPVSFTQFQCWAVNKSDTALLDSLNSWIPEVRSLR